METPMVEPVPYTDIELGRRAQVLVEHLLDLVTILQDCANFAGHIPTGYSQRRVKARARIRTILDAVDNIP